MPKISCRWCKFPGGKIDNYCAGCGYPLRVQSLTNAEALRAPAMLMTFAMTYHGDRESGLWSIVENGKILPYRLLDIEQELRTMAIRYGTVNDRRPRSLARKHLRAISQLIAQAKT